MPLRVRYDDKLQSAQTKLKNHKKLKSPCATASNNDGMTDGQTALISIPPPFPPLLSEKAGGGNNNCNDNNI